ncbi:MAG: hypothetical protein FWC26_13715 [Fibromonadales bacterium]|nr:hypothetical protein [Fibromonadales bacterium]
MQIAHAHHNHGSFAAHHSKTAANAKAKHAAFGTMLNQMQAASHTPTAKTETAHPKPNYAAIMSDVEEKIKAEICKKAAEQQEAASQEAEQPKPGANSQAAANSVNEIMALLVRPPMEIIPHSRTARPTPAAAYIFVPDVGIVEKKSSARASEGANSSE